MPNANEIALPLIKEVPERPCDPETGGKLGEDDPRAMTESFGGRALGAAKPQVAESTPEVLEACLKGLEADYKRGIVVVDDEGTVNDFKAALEQDKTAGTSWEQVNARLLANDRALLKQAETMQGKGTLIGVYANGELCIKDRGNEPVIYGSDKAGKPVKVTTDTLERDAVMQRVRSEGQFADYWKLREAVHNDGFILPPDAPDFLKKGLVAAVEAVTGQSFVPNAISPDQWRSAALDCGNVSDRDFVRIVLSKENDAVISIADPLSEYGEHHGAVRVLRG